MPFLPLRCHNKLFQMFYRLSIEILLITETYISVVCVCEQVSVCVALDAEGGLGNRLLVTKIEL